MGSNNINSNLNSFFTKVLQQGIADKNKDGVVSNEEKTENDVLLGFSKDVSDLFSLTSEGNWEEALELAENIDIAAKQETANQLSREFDVNGDNKIDMSEIEDHELYSGLTNIFTDATTTFKMEDFENFAQMLDIDGDTEVTNNEKTVFNSLTSAVKAGSFSGVELNDTDKANVMEALQQTVLGNELETRLIDAMKAFNGAALVKLETEQGIKDYESVEISSGITYNIAGWSNFDEDTKDKIIKMLEVKDTGLWSTHDGYWLDVAVSEDGDSITLTNNTNLNLQFAPNSWITQSMSAKFDNDGIYESYVDAYQTVTNNTKRTQYCFNGDISENIKTQDGELVSSSLTRFLPNGKSWKYTNYMNGTFGEERIHVEYDADGNVLQEQRHFNLPSNAVFTDIETGLVFKNLDNQEAQSIMIIKFPDGTVEVTGNSLKIDVDAVMSAQDNSSNSREDYKLIVNGDNNDIRGTFKDDQITVRGNNNTVRGAMGNDNIKVYGNNNNIDPEEEMVDGGAVVPNLGSDGDDTITVIGHNNNVNATLGNDNIKVTGDNNNVQGGTTNTTVTIDSLKVGSVEFFDYLNLFDVDNLDSVEYDEQGRIAKCIGKDDGREFAISYDDENNYFTVTEEVVENNQPNDVVSYSKTEQKFAYDGFLTEFFVYHETKNADGELISSSTFGTITNRDGSYQRIDNNDNVECIVSYDNDKNVTGGKFVFPENDMVILGNYAFINKNNDSATVSFTVNENGEIVINADDVEIMSVEEFDRQGLFESPLFSQVGSELNGIEFSKIILNGNNNILTLTNSDDSITVYGNSNTINALDGNDNITVIGSDNVIDGDLGDFVKTYNSQNQLENIIVNGVTIDASGINTICQNAFNDVQNIPSLENINFVLELLSKISLDDEIDETDVAAFNYTIALIANDSEISEDEKQVIFDALANYIYGIDLDDEQKDIVDTFIYTAKGLRQSWQEE